MESIFEIDDYGDKWWRINGELHRDGDLPAKVCVNGDKSWYQYDELYRDGDKPAIEYANGDKEWYIHGGWEYHRMVGYFMKL